MGFFGTVYNNKKDATVIKKAVAISSATKAPITMTKRSKVISPFLSNIKAELAPIQLPYTDFKTKLYRSTYDSSSSTKRSTSTPRKTIVKTPTLDIIRPFVSQIKTVLAPVDKVTFSQSTPSETILKQTQLITKTNTSMQKVTDFIKTNGIKLLIPLALLVAVFIYLKKRKSTAKRK